MYWPTVNTNNEVRTQEILLCYVLYCIFVYLPNYTNEFVYFVYVDDFALAKCDQYDNNNIYHQQITKNKTTKTNRSEHIDIFELFFL